jgi:hypothetical protein
MKQCFNSIRESAGKCATWLQGIVAIGAAVGAVFWWVYGRDAFPRMNIDMEVQGVALNDGRDLVRITMHLNNTGRVLVHVRRIKLKIHQVNPIRPDDGTRHGEGLTRTKLGNSFTWPVLVDYECKRLNMNIEPGEVDQFNYECILDGVPEAATVQVEIFDSNKENDYGWSISKLIDISGNKLTHISVGNPPTAE